MSSPRAIGLKTAKRASSMPVGGFRPPPQVPLVDRIAGWIAEEQARVKVAIDAAFEKLRQAGLRTSVVVKEEEPKALLLNEAEGWNADCIFVGARGVGRSRGF